MQGGCCSSSDLPRSPAGEAYVFWLGFGEGTMLGTLENPRRRLGFAARSESELRHDARFGSFLPPPGPPRESQQAPSPCSRVQQTSSPSAHFLSTTLCSAPISLLCSAQIPLLFLEGPRVNQGSVATGAAAPGLAHTEGRFCRQRYILLGQVNDLCGREPAEKEVRNSEIPLS